MSSLAETYNGSPTGALWSKKELIAGVSLFVTGLVMSTVAIIAGATDVFVSAFDLRIWESWKIGGLVGGVGVPLLFIGVFMVIPTARLYQLIGAFGVVVALIGVYLFYVNFPFQWYRTDVQNAPLVVAVYAAGLALMFWSLFNTVVNFKTRNNPGGTVSLKMVVQGKERIVEVSREDFEQSIAGSGVGLFGNPSTEHVETQTALKSEQSMRGSQSSTTDSRSTETNQSAQQPQTPQQSDFDSDGTPSLRDAEIISDD